MKSVCVCFVFLQLFIVTQTQVQGNQYNPYGMTGGGGNVVLGTPQQNPNLFTNTGYTDPAMISNHAPIDPNAVADPVNNQGGILGQQAVSSQPNPQPFASSNPGSILSSLNFNRQPKKRNQGMNMQQLLFFMMAMEGF